MKSTTLLTALVATSLLAPAPAAELLRNGNFDSILTDWVVNRELGGWTPYVHPDANIKLQRGEWPLPPYSGKILRQNLNVSGIADQSVDFSIDLTSPRDQGATHSVNIYLIHLDTAGDTKRVSILNPINSSIPDTPTNFTASHTFPSDAAKLIALEIACESTHTFTADNLSLSSDTLTPDPVPTIHDISPDIGKLGTTCVITGENFGTTQGEVLINGTDNGITIDAWADTRIDFTIGLPSGGGPVTVVAGGVQSTRSRGFEVTSPHAALGIFPNSVIAAEGQTVTFDCAVYLINGFTTTSGIQLSVPGTAPGATQFSPSAPLTADGGVRLQVNTAGMWAGPEQFELHGLSTNPPAGPVKLPFTIDVRRLDHIDFYTHDSNWNRIPAPDPLVLTSSFLTGLYGPGSHTTDYDLIDKKGLNLTGKVPIEWSSADPDICDVFTGSPLWSPQLLPMKNGSTTITGTGPGTFTFTQNITVSIPSPNVTDLIWDANPMPNDGTTVNTFTIHTASDMTIRPSVARWGLGGDWDGDWGPDHSSYIYELTVFEGWSPRRYLTRTKATTAAGEQYVYRVLTLANDPAMATVSGSLVYFKNPPEGEGAVGSLRFYESATETLAFSRDIWGDTKDFYGGAIAPGTYKIQWYEDGNPEATQWYPNAASHADAMPVTINAGDEIQNINFFYPPLPPDPVQLSGTMTMDPASDSMTVGAHTEDGILYAFEKSLSAEDGTWYTLSIIYGDGGILSFEDLQAIDPFGFYRIKRLE